MSEEQKKKWFEITYACFECGEPTFKVHNRFSQNFVVRHAEVGEPADVVCIGCLGMFRLFENPNPPGRIFLRKKVNDVTAKSQTS